MSKGRGKGKLSYDLVAASCAAVLAVYAAGYARTRDAARRFETASKERRPAIRTPQTAAVAPVPAQAAASAPAPASVPRPHLEHKAAALKGAWAKTVPVLAAVAQSPAAAPVSAVTPPGVTGVPAIAPVPLPPPETPPGPIAITREAATGPPVKWRDGTYTGTGSSAHGDIQARVVIRDGRIVEAGIALCDTRYPCEVIDPLIHQPVERQSPAVDYMSHATESSDAYYDGLVEALNNAREPAPAAPVTPK